MARYVPAFNPGITPVLIDAEGRQIAGGEWGVADTTAVEVIGAPVGSVELVTIPGQPGEDAQVVERVRDEPLGGAVELGTLVLRPELLDRDLVEGAPGDAVAAAREANKPAKAAGARKAAGDTPPPDESQE